MGSPSLLRTAARPGVGSSEKTGLPLHFLRLNAGVFFGERAICVTRYGVLPAPSSPAAPLHALSPAGVFLAADLRIFDNRVPRGGPGPMPLLDALENPHGRINASIHRRSRGVLNPLSARARAARSARYSTRYNDTDRVFRIASCAATGNVALQLVRATDLFFYYLKPVKNGVASPSLKISTR